MAETQTHDVIVHKASISLADGESIQQYTKRLREAGVKFIGMKLNLVKDSSVYPVEIFSKSLVFDVYQYGPNVDADKRARFFAAAYTRKANGDFEFSTLTEVERVTVYQPKSSVSITKALADGEAHPGWNVKKALFEGVV